MSQEDLTRFLEAVRQDPSLQEKLRAEGADPVATAGEAGFSITQAELLHHQVGRTENLSDEDLENLAGGECWIYSLLASVGDDCGPEGQF